MLVTSCFCVSCNIFYSRKDRNQHLNCNYIAFCKCFESGKVNNFVMWERVKNALQNSWGIQNMGSFFSTLSVTHFVSFKLQTKHKFFFLQNLIKAYAFVTINPHFCSYFDSWACPWARHFRAQPSTGETQESINNVSCRRDMTKILLKAV